MSQVLIFIHLEYSVSAKAVGLLTHFKNNIYF